MSVRTVLSIIAGGGSVAALVISRTSSTAAIALWLLTALAFLGLLIDGRNTDS